MSHLRRSLQRLLLCLQWESGVYPCSFSLAESVSVFALGTLLSSYMIYIHFQTRLEAKWFCVQITNAEVLESVLFGFFYLEDCKQYWCYQLRLGRKLVGRKQAQHQDNGRETIPIQTLTCQEPQLFAIFKLSSSSVWLVVLFFCLLDCMDFSSILYLAIFFWDYSHRCREKPYISLCDSPDDRPSYSQWRANRQCMKLCFKRQPLLKQTSLLGCHSW